MPENIFLTKQSSFSFTYHFINHPAHPPEQNGEAQHKYIPIQVVKPLSFQMNIPNMLVEDHLNHLIPN